MYPINKLTVALDLSCGYTALHLTNHSSMGIYIVSHVIIIANIKEHLLKI